MASSYKPKGLPFIAIRCRSGHCLFGSDTWHMRGKLLWCNLCWTIARRDGAVGWKCKNGHDRVHHQQRNEKHGTTFCRICRAEYQKRYKGNPMYLRPVKKPRTKCRRGHSFQNPENVAYRTDGVRICVKCRDNKAAKRARNLKRSRTMQAKAAAKASQPKPEAAEPTWESTYWAV